MNILITNDDGIASSGIKALEAVLQKEHDTFLIAPLRERSATSMALSIYDSMRVERINDNHYIVDGYPADCVNIGLHGDIFPRIDLVLSGINRGVNMGHDIHYSGTVGAARHGAVHSRLSLAVSSGNITKDYDYIREAEFVRHFIDEYSSLLKVGVVYNMNIPFDFVSSMENLRITRLGKRTYEDTYSKKNIIGGIADFYLGGSKLEHATEEGTDFTAFFSGKISLTPLSLDQTDISLVQELSDTLSKSLS
ncbi:5'/3'-nucleotidase SurE [Leptospira borgpetersenii]|uniref:5'-nucleotidase SurE n=1 Tax=Leptospira borgpetersenii serovar Hardjo-bovis (strain JB197) TaxID=355277 RepID=SURE_LEPBJ|nr:5'/3'-nucleotidase SurE [Leptospira borgpetersenii]Q04Q98.1 RecName: Full=5'-nucleotidase SurE; AltName: Full=Nucleoside 5'-monophosphate phosphohydrolase [Leptospira borgpetersenii serovar Hardjo-bovis str. JB197]ABJ76922.1 Acid phosphatase [Leptospira borgpetersenii serovar Hardjo-bovis str. JB197]AMX72182.1 5'-nucleotidase surE [Leptospira borgpetersenii serovar Hardjo]